MFLRALLPLLVVMLSACTSTSSGPDGETRYRYSTFDFSGKSWVAQKQYCETLGMKPKHLDTVCGFLLCTSRYACEPKTQ